MIAMAKITKHGGPSVNPEEPIRITRAEIGGTPVAEDVSEAMEADKASAEEEAEKIEAADSKPSPKKSTGKK